MRPADDGFHHIVLVDTSYNVSGPAQARPPEGVLRAGIRVRVLEQAGGHARIETEDGVRGYVASDALACDATPRACARPHP
jgi:hypothetical protein